MSIARSSPLLVADKHAAIAAYVAFALFPRDWLFKIAITPQHLIYTDGTALWPARTTMENFCTVIFASDLMTYFAIR